MRIVVVDQNKKSLNELANIVRTVRPDATVVECANEVEALTYADVARIDVAFLDTKYDMMLGTVLAGALKKRNEKLNIIFVTTTGMFRNEAFALHASGYIGKPATAENIKSELADLRYPVEDEKEILRAVTFGNFDAYTIDGKPLRFARSKAKELFAYLIYRRGTSTTTKEIASILFEDAPYDNKTQVYLQKIISTMMQCLKEAGVEEVINKDYNALAVDASKIKCDYFDVLNGQKAVGYTGEFMSQYSWAED
ncbi:MAG: response regulator, partial [Clostridia bacterium]|nr:response regulator [Clostridia bacterium]